MSPRSVPPRQRSAQRRAATPAGTAPAAGPTPSQWDAALAGVLADPSQPALHAQPIVELTGGTVAGHELLARFSPAVASAPPDRWFAAAQQRGLSATLQARIIHRGLGALDHLHPNTFLSLNVDPAVVDDDAVLAALGSRTRLDRLVVELTEHTQPHDLHELDQVVADLRARGALVAVDDAGTGYAGLTQLLRLRPDIVKVDRELVSGVDADPVKRAMVAMLGDLAGRMDAWLLTEGVETRAELEVLLGLGVPLGQGYHLGAPSARMSLHVDPDVVEQVRGAVARTAWSGHVVTLLRPATTTTDPLRTADVLLDEHGRPRAVWEDDAAVPAGGWRTATTLAPSTDVRAAALRAMARPPRERYARLVCTDGQGRVVGTVAVADLITALAGSSPDPC